MCSKSSSEPLPLGPVRSIRGAAGELTVRVASGDASRWTGLTRVWVARKGASSPQEAYGVRSVRAYRDRLVLLLDGVEDGAQAEALRGAMVYAPGEEVPPLEEGRFYFARLVGLEVDDVDRGVIGKVVDVLETGGCDVLVVEERDGQELLIPMAPDVLLEAPTDQGRIRVRMSEELRSINRTEDA